jgi:hypothetical protein
MNDTSEKPACYLPIVHLNGTDRKDLFDGYDKADDVASKLQRSLIRDITFHQRDYYVIPGQWERAVKERDEVLNKLADIRDYINQHMKATVK